MCKVPGQLVLQQLCAVAIGVLQSFGVAHLKWLYDDSTQNELFSLNIFLDC